ncbi:hypothetical protein [Sorlinia euscelidii]|uniref:hypothetical protein n=1 Tax=Sorlinia euscelidii TaxID=3081148 RepID=UPI00374E0899
MARATKTASKSAPRKKSPVKTKPPEAENEEALITLTPKGRGALFASVAALAGLMFGLDTGVISGALKFLSDDLHSNPRLDEWIVSSLMLGRRQAQLRPPLSPSERGANRRCWWRVFCSSSGRCFARWPRMSAS